MAVRLPTASRNAAADAIVDRADAGAAAGKLRIYTGAQPASANDAASGTLLADVTLVDPAFGNAATGVATLADPGAVTGSAAGNAGWFRILDSDLNTVMDGSVTATGGGGDLTLSNISIASGQTVDITGGSVTMPAG